MKKLLLVCCLALSACTTSPAPAPVPVPTPIPTPTPTPVPVPPIAAAPVITTQPSPYTVNVGTYIFLWSTLADDAGITFQWYKNGQPTSGAINIAANGSTQYVIWIPASALSDAGDYYVVFTNPSGSTKSDVVTISVVAPAPPLPIPPLPTATALLIGCGSCDGSAQGIVNIDALASFMNKPVDLVLVWGWADSQSSQEYWATNRDQLWPAKYKILWDMPMIIQGTTFADCYNGKYDSSYKIVATTISARDSSAIMRIGHEMNGNWYDWSMNGPAGTAAEFAQCFQHIVGVFRQISPGFKFDWNPGIGEWAGLDAVTTYPGDAFVDYVSLDMYEDAQYTDLTLTPDQRWQQNFVDVAGRGLTYWAQFVKDHKKQMGIDEWASNIDDGSMITHMAQWMQTNPVHHQMYWDSDAAFKGSFASNPNNGVAFQKLFGKPATGLLSFFHSAPKEKAKIPPKIVGPRAHKWTLNLKKENKK